MTALQTTAEERPAADLESARHHHAGGWGKPAPSPPRAEAALYPGAEGVADDLHAWHATPERRQWTAALVKIAREIEAASAVDVGCGVGHDLLALRAAGVEFLFGVEPNERARHETVVCHGISTSVAVSGAPIETADLLVCIDVLEHLPDPESFLDGIAARARVGAFLVEATATTDLGTPLHLASNRGWHPGRCLESRGFALADRLGRLRVWRKVSAQSVGKASVILVAHRDLTVQTHVALGRLDPGCWRLLDKTGDGLVDRARSSVASQWWRETADDVFLMVDDDIVFEPIDANWLLHRCREGLDIVCGAYPVRNGAHFALKTLGPTRLGFGPAVEPVEIRWAGTGFMAVHRRVLDALIPTLPFCHPDQDWGFWPMFLPMIHTDENGLTTELSEDWAFCERARRLGFRVWLDGSVRVRHLGQVAIDAANMSAIHAAVTGG